MKADFPIHSCFGRLGSPHLKSQVMIAPGPRRHAYLRRSIALITAVMLAACTSLQAVPIEAGRAPEGVGPGDTVTVTTVRGEEIEFEVVRVDADALVGEDAQVAFKDIATLEVKKPAPGKTAGLIAGGVVTVVAIVVGLFLFIAASIPATGG